MVTTSLATTAKKKIPFVHGLPFIGSYIPLMYDRLNFLKRLAEKGEISGFYQGRSPCILLTKPELIHMIFVEHASDFPRGRRLNQRLQSNALLKMEAEPHRKRRKLLAPIFHPRQISRYADIMTQHAEQLQQQWKDGTVIDLHEQMADLAMNIIGKVVFDVDGIAEDGQFRSALAYTFQKGPKKMFGIFSFPESWPTPSNRKAHQAKQAIGSLLQRLTQHRFGNGQETQQHDDIFSALLQLRYEDGSKMSRQEITSQCGELLSAGHDTIATSLIWTWFLLAQHPDIHQKMQQEIDRVLEGRTPQFDDLEHLPYCLQVYKEALRLYPPAPLMDRGASRDIEIDGYLIRKGTTVFHSAYIMHHKAEYYPEPERFDPERFSPAREKDIPRHAYLPFGAGPRTCIAQHFALMEGHLLLTTLAQRVTFAFLSGQKPEFNLTRSLSLIPKGKVEAVVKHRQ